MKKQMFVLYIIVLSALSGCTNKDITSSSYSSWTSLGLDLKLVGELLLYKNHLFACAGRDGLFRLDLQKQVGEWEYLGFSDTTLPRDLLYGVTSIYVDQKKSTLLVGISTPETEGTGVFVSNDNGITWSASDSGVQSARLPFSTQVHSINGTSLTHNATLLGMEATIFKSVNGGSFWELVYGHPDAGGLGINSIKFNPSMPNEVWAGGETGRFAPLILFSEDYGDTWKSITLSQAVGPLGQDNAVYDIAVDPKNKGTVYFGMLGLVLKSTDYGDSWDSVLFKQDGVHRHWRLKINPSNSKELFVTGARVYYTIDGGSNWSALAQVSDKEAFYALYVDWNRRVLYASTSGPISAIYKTIF